MSDPSPTPQGAPEGTTSAAGAASKGWFESFVARLSRAIGRHPVWIVVAAALLAVVGGYVYAQHLKLVNDRSQMTDPSLPFNKNYRQYVESFGDDNKFLILVVRSKGDAPPDKPRREAMKIFAKRWSEVLREEPALFPRVVERLDLDAIISSSLQIQEAERKR